jgi:tetratricopeptide (TPR) repeat protein/serine/threonine protein kinase
LPPASPQGPCPACLLRAGLASQSESPVGPLDGSAGAEPVATAPVPVLEGTGEFTPAPKDNLSAGIRRLAIAEAPGTMIGPYKLLQQIGEGGMGTVFMAEQLEPVRRRVALKVIKPGMDTGQVIARFEAERQALALMDHPNIARVLDAGATRTGRPFFVMELVRGVPLSEYCDQNRLTPDERLALFIPVCQAIQHAHQKGIIHRDIKPSNVLVTLHDGKPVPKVIDFGVAKAIDQRLTEKTMFTEFGAVIGTLEYMSPEQAEMGALDIDTRSDIYSLGVMLYELLTGSTPLERARLRKAAYSEILRRIREEEPARPSTRLSESKDALPSISAQRKMEPARLTRLVRGDLDWVVMKALEKDRTRRYETATGFARDIERYLAGDAVEACPPSASYKLRKFARKHRAALATVTSFAVLLVAATALSGVLAWWANRERMRAVTAETLATAQQRRAERREELAIGAVKRFRDAVVDSPGLKDVPALGPLRKTLLNAPLEFFNNLRDQLQKDQDPHPASLARLASAVFELGTLADEIGNKQNALRTFEESLAIRARLAREQPSVLTFQSNLALSHYNIARMQVAAGRLAEALASYDRALAIQEPLVRGNPRVTAFQNDLARTHSAIGKLLYRLRRWADGLAAHKQARAILERLARDNPSVTAFPRDLARSDYQIARTQGEMLQTAEALAAAEGARAVQEGLLRQEPSATAIQDDLAESCRYIGCLRRDTGRTKEGLERFEQARALWERLVRENPTVTAYQVSLAQLYGDISRLQSDAQLMTDPLASLEQARAILERLARENPSDTDFQRRLARSHAEIGTLTRYSGRPEEALAAYELARAIRERVAREATSDQNDQEDLAALYGQVGVTHAILGHPADAMAAQEEARAILERLTRANPEAAGSAHRLATVLDDMALIDLSERRFAAARDRLTQAIALERKALAADPDRPYSRTVLEQCLRNLIKAQDGLGRADLAADAGRELQALRESRAEQAPRATRASVIMTDASHDAAAQYAFGLALSNENKRGQAAAAFREALRLDPDHASAHYNLGLELNGINQHAEAIQELRQATRLKPDFADAHGELGWLLLNHGTLDDSLKASRAAIALEPGLNWVHGNLGVALFRQGKLDEAIAEFKEAIRLVPGRSQDHDNLGLALLRQKKYAEAAVNFRETVRLNPENARAYNSLGVALRDQGKRDEALTEFRTAARLDADRGLVGTAIGNLDRLLGDLHLPDETVVLYRRTVMKAPDNVKAHVGLALALDSQGKYAEAVDACEKALRLKPDDAITHTELGLILSHQGKPAEAIAQQQESIRLKPDYALPHDRLGNALVAQGKLDDASAEFQKAVELDPKFDVAYDHLGSTLRKQGKLKESLVAFRRAGALAKPASPLGRAVAGRIRLTERMIAVADRLPAVLNGEDRPRNTDEVDAFYAICRDQERYAAAARLLTEYLAADPKLAASGLLRYRYNTACVAALAGCGKSRDDPAPDEPARAALRRLALDWLNAERGAAAARLDSGTQEGRANVVKTLRRWQQDADLAGVRDEAEVVRLPEEEQKAWRGLWAEVQTLVKTGEGG